MTWKLGDLININNDHALINYKNMKIMRTLKTNFGNKSHIDPRKNQSSFADNTGRAFKLQSKVSHKKNMSAYEENFYNKNISSEIKKDFGKRQSIIPEEEERQIDFKELNPNLISEATFDNQPTTDKNEIKNENSNKNNAKPNIYHKFVLSVSDVNLGGSKIGYIFTFELYNGQNFGESSYITTKLNTKISLKKPPTITNDYEKSEVSLVSFTPKMVKPEVQQVIFNATKENPGGVNLGLDNTYIPVLSIEEEFIIDVDKLSFKQRGQIENEYNKDNEFDKLRQKAIEKISKIKLKKENEAEEDESSSYSSSYEEDEDNSEENSSKEKVDITSEIISSQKKKLQKKKRFYHL